MTDVGTGFMWGLGLAAASPFMGFLWQGGACIALEAFNRWKAKRHGP